MNEVIKLNAADAPLFREIRLEALQDSPGAFSSTFEDEKSRPLERFADRIGTDDDATFAIAGDKGELIAVAEFTRLKGGNSRHRGEIWGVYVTPEHRGKGLAEQLVNRIIEFARGRVEIIELAANRSNEPACNLYRKLGFISQGNFVRAVKIGDQYFDEEQFALHF